MSTSMDAMFELTCNKAKFECELGELYLHVVDCDGREFAYAKDLDGRWRWRKGPYVSALSIAARLFRIESFVSKECESTLLSIVNMLGDLMVSFRKCMKDSHEEGLRLGREQLLEDLQEHSKRRQAERQAARVFVYIMSHTNGMTKIGISSNPHKREKTLQSEDPRLHMVCFFEGSRELEKRLHSIFAARRVRGEWFDLEPHHIEWIRFLFVKDNGGAA